MKLNSNLPAFTGYYGSIFEDCDTSSELDYINEQRAEKGLDPLSNDYDIEWDYKTYYDEMNVALTSTVEDFLIELGLVKSIKFVALHSPKFYNYSNDVIECVIDVDVKAVKSYINSNLESFAKYLGDNFKSCSGFISFYEHGINAWLTKMNKSFKNLDHIEVYAILDFICQNEDFDIVDRLYNHGMNDVPNLYASNIDDLISC